MRYYDYDNNGWLIGSKERAEQRPNSTPLDFRPIPPHRARFVGGAWTDDPGREQAEVVQAQAAAQEAQRRAQAIALLEGLDFDAATAAQTRQAVRAMWVLLRSIRPLDSWSDHG